MRKYFVLTAVISKVITSPLPDFTSQEQQQWSDTKAPFLLSTQPNDQLLASNSQQDAQTGFEETNVLVPSMPFAMAIHRVAVGGGDPSILSNEEVNPSTSFDVATTNLFSSSTVPSPDPGLTPASSKSPGSDTTSTSTDPTANTIPNSSSPSSSSSPPLVAAPPGSEVPMLGSTPGSSSSPPAAAPTGSEVPVPGLTPDSFSSAPAAVPTGSEVPDSGSTQEQAPLDIDTIFEPPIMDEDKRYAAFECGGSASVCCLLLSGSQAKATPKALSCSNSRHPPPLLPPLPA